MKNKLLMTTALCAMTAAGFAETRKPNVVIFYTDDQPRDSFGFINGKAHTPNIDKLAKDGAYFSHAYATSSVCSPSRYSCLTGQFASRCQSREFLNCTSPEGMTRIVWNMGIGDKQWNFPRVMQANGYTTGMIGKWHVGNSSQMGKRKVIPSKDIPTTDPKDPRVIEALKYNQELYKKDIATFGFDYVGAVFNGNPNDDQNLVRTGTNVHAPEWQTYHALKFIEENKDRPFVLYYASTLLHVSSPTQELKIDPRLSPIGWLEKPYDGILPSRQSVIDRAKEHGVKMDKIDQIAGPYHSRKEVIAALKEVGVDKEDLGKIVAATWLDDVVGVVQNKLKELGLDKNTLIIYFNDNGTDDQGKGTNYQGGAHVPMMAYLPGVVKPGVRPELVGNIDIAPTIFEWCGVTAPKDMVLDGVSLMPLLRGETVKDWRDSMYLEIGLTRAVVTDDGFKYLAFRVPESYTNRPLEDIQQEHKTALEAINKSFPWTKSMWKYEEEKDNPRYFQMGMAPGGHHMERFQVMLGNPPFKNHYFDKDQLFNLEKDPREQTNLARNPEYNSKVEEMKVKLSELLEKVPGTFEDLKPTEN